MYVVISRDHVQLPPGAVVRIPGTWQDYQAICASLGNGSMSISLVWSLRYSASPPPRAVVPPFKPCASA